MRIPLEYGDNFPVPSGSWHPGVPWRFPRQQVQLRDPSLLNQSLPWVMLVMGGVLGVLWMSLTLSTLDEKRAASTVMIGKQVEKPLEGVGSKNSLGKPAGSKVYPRRRPAGVQSRLA